MKEVQLTKPYSFGPYNVVKEEEQWIRLTEGCPNQCSFCAEPLEQKVFEIPEIVRNNVKILDMNLIAKPQHKEIIMRLQGKLNNKVIHYELTCGIDYRFLTEETSELLKTWHFINPRIAWDFGFDQQYKVKDAIDMLVEAGYRRKEIMIFMICNWRTTYEENCRKLDLLKVWNVKVGDCWFDNQLSPNIKPIHWTEEQIKDFRRRCRKHNQLVLFGIDPELKGKSQCREETEGVLLTEVRP